MEFMHLHFTASSAPLAQTALKELTAVYVQNPIEDADAVIALGGDGFMLQCMKESLSNNRPVFGMNLGTRGFLMNPFKISDLPGRLERAESIDFHPLQMTVSFADKEDVVMTAFNECTLRRMECQTAHIRVRSFLDGQEKVIADTMIGDGIIVATPLGSTGYYTSASRGRTIPWTQKKLGIQSVCVMPEIHHKKIDNRSAVLLENLDPQKRSLIASADNQQVDHPISCRIVQSRQQQSVIMFDRRVFMKKMLLQHLKQFTH